MSAVHYDSYSEARVHLKDLLDAAEHGRPVTVRRETAQAAVVDVGRMQHFLASVVPSRAQVVAEADGWQDHLLDVANHRENWGLVQLISLSDDKQLRDWVVSAS